MRRRYSGTKTSTTSTRGATLDSTASSAPAGFEWVEGNDATHSVFAFLRNDAHGNQILAVFNCTPVPRENYRVGVPRRGPLA